MRELKVRFRKKDGRYVDRYGNVYVVFPRCVEDKARELDEVLAERGLEVYLAHVDKKHVCLTVGPRKKVRGGK